MPKMTLNASALKLCAVWYVLYVVIHNKTVLNFRTSACENIYGSSYLQRLLALLSRND